MKKPSLSTQAGQKGWAFASDRVEAFITRTGGQLAPVTFKLGRRAVQPFSITPWGREKLRGVPTMLKVLRGDFFCCPFGGNAAPWQGEQHPPHGETANRDWTLGAIRQEGGATTLQASMQLRTRPGRVDKRLILRDGHTAVYSEHVVSGFSGPMPIGTHPMIKFPDQERAGYISTSKMLRGHVVAEAWEQPEAKGYSLLKTGATFTSLQRVPSREGGTVDISRFPVRRGREELVELINDLKSPFAWSAVALPSEGYVFLALKDPRVLRGTILWMSNGGRYYAPWNGRHVNVVGVEDVTAYFHLGLAESAKANVINRQGVPTAVELKLDQPLRVAHIMALAAIPKDFDAVRTVTPHGDGVRLTSRSGKSVTIPLDLGFIKG